MSGNRLLSQALGVAQTNTLITFLRFLTGVLVARELGPEGKGLFAALLVVPNMVLSFTELGIRRSAIQHLGEKKIPPEQVIANLLGFFILSALAGIAISALVFMRMGDPGIDSVLITLVLLGIPPQLFNKYLNGVFAGEQDFRAFNLTRLLPVILYLVALFGLLTGLELAVAGALGAILLSNLVTSWVSLYYLKRKHRVRVSFDREIMKSLASLGFVYATAMFLMKLNFRIDILILQHLSSLKEVGFYNQGVTVAEGWQAPFAIGAVVLAGTAHNRDRATLNEDLGQLFRLTLFFVLIASFLVWLLAPWFVPLVYGKVFTPSVGVVRGIIPAIAVLIMARVLASRIAGLKKTYLLIWIYFVALLLNIGLNFLLIPQRGSMGAVIASNISYSVSAIGVVWVYGRVSGQPLVDLIRFCRSDWMVIRSIPDQIMLRIRNRFHRPRP